MPDYAAPLPRIVLSRTLWLVLAWPLAGLAWQALVARARVAAARPLSRPRESRSAVHVALATLALTLASVAAHAIVLARLPSGSRTLLEHVALGAGAHRFEADLDLRLDSAAAGLALVACMLVLGAAARAARDPDRASPDTWTWLHLALTGVLLALVGDALTLVAIGWTAAGGSSAWRVGRRDPVAGTVAAMRVATAVASLVVGAALLFWTLGGAWAADDDVPDVQPRYASVRVGSGGAPAGRETAAGTMWLTMTSAPGARVFVDEARADFLLSPFVRAPLPSGAHTFRVQPGAGEDDVVVRRVVAAPGDDLRLVQIGPTLSLRAVADQLALCDAQGEPVVRDALDLRGGPAWLSAPAVVVLLWLFAAGLLGAPSAALTRRRSIAAAACGIPSALLGPDLLARAAVLVPNVPHARLVLPAMVAAMWLAVWRRQAGVRESRGRPSLGEIVFVRAPERMGELLASMERWVVGPIAGAVGTAARVAAWVAARVDEEFVARPGDAAAARALRAGRGLEALTGASLGGLAWAVVAAGALAALVHTVWPGR